MNPALRMYMMTQADQRETRRESTPEYTGAESRHMDPRWPAHNEPGKMHERWQDEPEMRRRRDEKGRYVMDEPMESRYRGKDGQWKAGTRRSEYDGGAYDTDPPGRRIGDDYDEDDGVQSNVIPWPYAPGMPHMPPESRMIGFGNRPNEYETRSHYDGGKAEAEVGGTMWMKPVHGRKHEDVPELDRETAEKWVRNMHGEDAARPTGGRWSMEELKPMAQKFGIKPDSDEFVEFYAMTNAMYSDYCEVAKKFNITSPEFYGMMAKAWMDDKDAMPDKTALYYEYIVKK